MKNSKLPRSPQGLKAGTLERKTAMGRGSTSGSTLKKGRGFAASPAQREKVRERPCLNCGRSRENGYPIDPAHVIARSRGGCDDADCVVPLCRLCHGAQERGEIDLLPLLEPGYRIEQAHAVLHVGLENARVRTAPSCYRGAG